MSDRVLKCWVSGFGVVRFAEEVGWGGGVPWVGVLPMRQVMGEMYKSGADIRKAEFCSLKSHVIGSTSTVLPSSRVMVKHCPRACQGEGHMPHVDVRSQSAR